MTRLKLTGSRGTHHFDSAGSARRYYAAYGYDSNDVAAKIRAGEIVIGKPQCLSNERVVLEGDGRYTINVYEEVYE